ncbi:hypothetical protein ACI77F_29220 [Pseudomonas tritici]|uniref:hypothetical protein n=1 Tax=Pseudomonas tritici TaxID=2745518 RepID=UPI00387B63A3
MKRTISAMKTATRMPLLAKNCSTREELLASHEHWRGDTLSALPRIGRVTQNVLEALSRNLKFFRGGILDSTNQPLTIGALHTHNLGEATFVVTGLFHNNLQGILIASPENCTQYQIALSDSSL